jgi:hypothetical protein
LSAGLDVAAAEWQLALDSAQRAARLASAPPILAKLAHDERALVEERAAVAAELRRLAGSEGIAPPTWLPPVADSLPTACGFPATRFRPPPDGARDAALHSGGKGRLEPTGRNVKGAEMRKLFEIGGFVATAVLIIFGVVAIVMGVNGRNTVQDSLKLEQIVGTPDMNAAAIAAEAKKAGLPASIKLPTTDVAGKPIDSGARAHAFASYMRIHALEATGGLPYSQLPRFATADGKGTSDPTKALTQNGKPVDNPIRQVWITETALSTALNASYLAENVALFGIVVGVALLLTGIGFGVLVIGGSLRGREEGARVFGERTPESAGTRALPVA